MQLPGVPPLTACVPVGGFRCRRRHALPDLGVDMCDLDNALHFGNLTIDTQAWEVRLGGTFVALSKTEYELLLALASRPRRVVTNDDLTRFVWGENWYGDDNNLAVHMSKLRGKLGESGIAPRYIRTVRGVGYRFEPQAGDTAEWMASGEDPFRATVVIVLSPDRRIRWISANVKELLGWEADDLIDVSIYDLALPADRSEMLAWKPHLDAGHPTALSGQARTASGHYRPIAVTVRPLLGHGGQLAGLLAEWQPAEAGAPRDNISPVHLDQSVDAADTPVVLTYDANFTLVDITPRIPILGWQPEEIIGRYFSTSDRDEATMRALADMLIGNETLTVSGAIHARHKNGSLIPMHSHTQIQVDDQGSFAGARSTLNLDE